MSTTTGPNQVLIIRHGEKVGDAKKDDDGGRHLSIQGSARAGALPAWQITFPKGKASLQDSPQMLW